jgi:hypothetical protein
MTEKLKKLETELKKWEARLKHMAGEYAATKEGSAYGVEYYDIQIKVYQEMIEEIKKEIEVLNKNRKKGI